MPDGLSVAKVIKWSRWVELGSDFCTFKARKIFSCDNTKYFKLQPFMGTVIRHLTFSPNCYVSIFSKYFVCTISSYQNRNSLGFGKKRINGGRKQIELLIQHKKYCGFREIAQMNQIIKFKSTLFSTI